MDWMGSQGKQKPGTTERSVTAKAEAGLRCGDDPSKVNQPANGKEMVPRILRVSTR